MMGIRALKHASATRVVASTLSVLGGLASMGHGIFEMLQGNVTPDSIRIEAIGPAQRFWEHGGEPALTIIPNFFITGILATLISLFVIIWAVGYIDKKFGLWGLILLTVLMLLFGGGFAPPTFMILAILAATRINKPLIWWRKFLPLKLQYFLARLWPWVLLVLVILVLFAIEAGIFGYPLMWIFDADNTLKFLRTYGLITTFGLGPVAILSAFAYDVQKQSDVQQTSLPEG
jgi:hypothetical protein